MKLIMFDVDGTLTGSCDLESRTYLDALREVFGFRDVSGDWATYRHVTDGGILQEVFEKRLRRLPAVEETEKMREQFTALLATRIEEAGGVRPMAGAAELLERLAALPDEYAVAYASGGWGATARLKLRSAGLPFEEVPGAFADDGLSRAEICRVAHRRAEERSRCGLPTVVYVGDGVWDVRTSRQMGYGFVGIGCDTGAAKLRSEGAVEVVSDFQDQTAFFAAVARASSNSR